MKGPDKMESAANLYIGLKGADWLERQRVAGRVTANALRLLRDRVAQKTTATMAQLSAEADDYILSEGCTATFKNYKWFPAAVCISVNKQLVHGIPDDYRLQDGDVVSFDLGATYKGAIADSAITCIFGEAKSKRHVQLLAATEKSLELGIAQVAVGKRLGSIGHAIYRFGRQNDFGVVSTYGGHGIDEDKPHAPPFVSNRAEPNEGLVIQSGLTIAIEPMFVIGSNQARLGRDGWTVWTDDIGAHFEHTIFVHDDHVEVMTRMDQ